MPLAIRGDERGRLVAIEGMSDVPCTIARVYCVYAATPGATRGLHAHRALHQMAVAVAGSCTMLLDDGAQRVTVRLNNSATRLTLPPMVRHG